VDALTLRLCSQNEHKRAELARVLSGWRVEQLDAVDYPAEIGATFYENARAKARYGREVGSGGEWMLGEDSGLELAALGGRPGVETARWAEGRHVERALEALEGEDDRSARYVCELVAIAPDGFELRATGTLDGAIAREPRGEEGFGFDPVFVPAGEERTVAELGDAWKAEHSHRARAATALLEALSKEDTAGV
jgi:XTP/dITP diphosphohydrolase